MVAIVGDIHLNLRKYPKFELNRFLELARLLASKKYSTVILAGDLFDIARPTLEELQAMQEFITIVSEHATIYIIDGNHEAVSHRGNLSTFDFVTFTGATYIKHKHVTVENTDILLTSWSYRGMLKTITKEDIVISHVRSKLPPHITAELPFDFTKYCSLVILGDIHDKYSPYKNVHYTNSPYATKFTSTTPSGSFIELNPNTKAWKYVDTNLPQKIKVTTDVATVLQMKFKQCNLYHIFVEDSMENLRKLPKLSNVEYTKIIKQVEVEHTELPSSVDFLDLLTDNVTRALNLDKDTKVKPILKEYT